MADLSAESELLAEIPIGSREVIRVTRQAGYQGKPILQLRMWFRTGSAAQLRPSKSGIEIPPKALALTIAALQAGWWKMTGEGSL